MSQAFAFWQWNMRLLFVFCSVLFIILGGTARAHPHVFVDGGIDFIFLEDGQLGSIVVTWRYDAFETLYLLSDIGIIPEQGADFTDQDRALVEERLGEFPSDFDGSAHLTVMGQTVSLDWPRDLTARLVGDRLEVSFFRDLTTPVALSDTGLQAQFYERTYFFAFSLTDAPDFIGDNGRCSGNIDPFTPSDDTQDLTDMLAQLSREETPQDVNVGATFTDTLEVTCNAA